MHVEAARFELVVGRGDGGAWAPLAGEESSRELSANIVIDDGMRH
jgi:hypothetical protein